MVAIIVIFYLQIKKLTQSGLKPLSCSKVYVPSASLPPEKFTHQVSMSKKGISGQSKGLDPSPLVSGPTGAP